MFKSKDQHFNRMDGQKEFPTTVFRAFKEEIVEFETQEFPKESGFRETAAAPD